ncbi:uncharacterized protein LOC108864820 [Galendromus occidentalis]|uniref:Uncharacterized protein LOC108864820 n=1 Tax=Galendromus occidentalis TaxID=34638 RepID=A0AAJ7L5P2_9ACAR|nr:uncharacterized protein LOC108864820 [Galendromus occidentalis]
MSASYRQTTVVTTTSTSPGGVITVNRSFISSISGILSCLQLAFALIIFIMTVQTRDRPYVPAYNIGLYFVNLTSFTYLIVFTLILLAAVLSITGTILPTTFFYFVLHCAAFSMYSLGGIAMLIKGYNESVLVGAAALCLVVGLCHVLHAMLIQRGRA